MTTNNQFPKTPLCFYAVNILTHDKAYPFQNVYQFHSLYLKFNNDKNPKNPQPPKTLKRTKNFPQQKPHKNSRAKNLFGTVSVSICQKSLSPPKTFQYHFPNSPQFSIYPTLLKNIKINTPWLKY